MGFENPPLATRDVVLTNTSPYFFQHFSLTPLLGGEGGCLGWQDFRNIFLVSFFTVNGLRSFFLLPWSGFFSSSVSAEFFLLLNSWLVFCPLGRRMKETLVFFSHFLFDFLLSNASLCSVLLQLYFLTFFTIFSSYFLMVYLPTATFWHPGQWSAHFFNENY